MKRLTFALSALLLGAYVAHAQTPPAGAPPHRGGPPFERIAQELNLDENQKPEVKRILEEQRAKHEAEREKFRDSGTRPTPEQMKAQMQADDAALYEQLKGVLRTDQLDKWKQLQEQRRARMMHMGPPPNGAPPEQK
jgi:Spy/CpxP family protein refolding chaperone